MPEPEPRRPHPQRPAPADLSPQLVRAREELAGLEARRSHLAAGTGPYRDTQIGRLTQRRVELAADGAEARRRLDRARRWQRPIRRNDLRAIEQLDARAAAELHQLIRPEANLLDRQINEARRVVHYLETAPDQRPRRTRAERFPELERSIAQMLRELADIAPETTPDHNRHPDNSPHLHPEDPQTRIDRSRARLDQTQNRPPARDDDIGLGL